MDDLPKISQIAAINIDSRSKSQIVFLPIQNYILKIYIILWITLLKSLMVNFKI